MKYAVFPQKILSRSDGDWHYISSVQLIKLYGVDPKDCIIIHFEDFFREPLPDLTDYVFLTPRYDGNYNLEDAIKRWQKK